ncbi:3'(2'),5'-bisphosphate nucleotidase CysQ [Sagittula sp. MA-2]|uniref:inositol monophosphatase family protein n=1 Tax=Sagittula sp. MA-2 TaxID=3048007 RepID=UPI0024C3C425|nr:3'(2'),5'-bisphosphate nucleotidase CysQ [Sagittula sp. MA-2]WHZ36166.1 3'(2'),5'-bisphosphate nucleotidase CysQ [Sagittula sp. MA-2]
MPETEADADLRLLTDAARRAGEIATGFIGQDLDIRYKDDDAGPVTRADLAVDTALKEILRPARPDYGWLSEETPDGDTRLGKQRVFIVDPIDGTRSYIEGSRAWAHVLAVVEDGIVMAAVVFLPMLDALYSARLGGGARLNGDTIAVSPRGALADAEVLATRPNLDPHHWPGGVPQVKRHHRPSLAYRQALVAEGRYDAMFTFRPSWEWDIAAGALILSEAGATVTDRRGLPLRFNGPKAQVDGLVAANPGLHGALMARLSDAAPGTPGSAAKARNR